MSEALRFAYADPPYLGCAHLYPEHPESAMWDYAESHLALARTLDAQFDGWALSCSTPSLKKLLPGMPDDVRIGLRGPQLRIYTTQLRIHTIHSHGAAS